MESSLLSLFQNAEVKWESLQNSTLKKAAGYTEEFYYVQVRNTESLM